MAIRFRESDSRPMGRNTSGVKGISLVGDDRVVGMVVADPEATLLTVCEKGYGKRTELSDYRTQSRGGKGLITIKCTERNGKLVGAVQVFDGDELMLISNQGTLVRTAADEVSLLGRNTQGVRIIRTKPGESLVQAERIVAIDADEPSVILKGPQGNLVEVLVRHPEKLEGVDIGDQVVITYKRALAVAVTPSPIQ